MQYYIYILSNKNRSVLYVGYTSNLHLRMKQHQKRRGAKFTRDYNVFDLLYYEVFKNAQLAKSRERQLKNWHKAWKWNLIRKTNPSLTTLEI
ncbi:GIY-YIG nuclease family protein [Salegentibacter sp. HM20]